MEILFYMALAAFLFYRLYNILGREEYAPNLTPDAPSHPSSRLSLEDIKHLLQQYDIPESLAPTYDHIFQEDPQFDIASFLKGAKYAYLNILRAAYTQDLVPFRPIIGDECWSLLQSFQPLNNPSSFDCSLKIIDTQYADSKVYMVIHYTSSWKFSQASHIHRQETWTFYRNIHSKDPNWILTKIIER